MSASTAERGRITARVTAYAQQVIERAAEMTATTTNQFVAQAALREAERVIEEERIIRLHERDANRFFDAIDNPPPVNERLAASLIKHLEARNDARDRVTTIKWTPRPRQL